MTNDPPDIAQARAEGWLGPHESMPDTGDLRRMIRDRKFTAEMIELGLVTPDGPASTSLERALAAQRRRQARWAAKEA